LVFLKEFYMRNYNAAGHKVFPRVPEIRIFYPANGVPHAKYVELMAIVDGDGKVQHTSTGAVEYTIDLHQITEPVQCVDPATGADIPGMTTSRAQLMLGLLAFIRADQKRRDAEAQQAQDDAAGTA
jgi:hypothetical protein